MKHLFFVSVALGIFSGTSITGNAQTSVNLMRLDDAVATTNSPKFIEGIEIKHDASVSAFPVANKIATKKASDFGTSIEGCSPLQFKYAQLMNMEVEAVSNFTLYNFIDEWWATRYRYGGSSKSGVDCSAYSGALLANVYGIHKLPRTARDLYNISSRVEKEQLKEGDLVFFNTRGGVSHVGVYLSNGYFTHASVGNGVTISNLEETYYSKKFIGGGRIDTDIDCGE